MLFYSLLSGDLLRVVSCKLQAQRTLEPQGQGASGCGPVPGAVARTPLFCRLTGFQAPPPPGPADLCRPLGLKPRSPEPHALGSRPPAPAPGPPRERRATESPRPRLPALGLPPLARSAHSLGPVGSGKGGGAAGPGAGRRPRPRARPALALRLAGWRDHGGLHPVLSLRGEWPGAGIHGRRRPRRDSAPRARPAAAESGRFLRQPPPLRGVEGWGPFAPLPFPPSPGPLGRLRPGAGVKETGAPSLARRRRRALGVPRFGPFPLPARLPASG